MGNADDSSPLEEPSDDLTAAEAYLDEGRVQEALDLLQCAVVVQPEDPQVLRLLAWSQLMLDLTPDACATAERLVAVQGDGEAHWLLAVCLLELIRHGGSRRVARAMDRTIECCHRAMELAPDSPLPWHVLTDAMLIANRTRQAIPVVDDAVRRFPQDPMTWLWRARVARAARDFETGEAAIRFALELDPLFAPAAEELGAILAAAGRSSESMYEMTVAEALDPESGQARQRMVAYGGRVFFIVALVLTCPLAFVWPLWIGATFVLHRTMFRWSRTRPTLERWSYAIAIWMSRRSRPAALRTRRPARSPFAPIRRQQISVGMLLSLTVLLSICGVGFTWATVSGSMTSDWSFVGPFDAITLAVAVACIRRMRPNQASILDDPAMV